MPRSSIIFFYLVAFTSIVALAQGSEEISGRNKASRKRRNKKGSGVSVVSTDVPPSPLSSSESLKVSPVTETSMQSRKISLETSAPLSVYEIVIKDSLATFNFIPPGLNCQLPSFGVINLRTIGPNQDVYTDLLNGARALDLLNSPDFIIPELDRFGLLPFIYFHQQRSDLFDLFFKKFDFGKVNPVILSGLLVECRNNRKYFVTILETQHQLIVDNFRSFWDLMLKIEPRPTDEELLEDEQQSNANITVLRQSFIWAFEHFAKLTDEKQQPLARYASFSIFNLLMADPGNPFPESLLQDVLNLSGIELNVALKGSCVALFTLGLPRLPEYYPKLILSDPRLNVNCIVPATDRKHGHITCHVPDLPLFWHALIYQNMRALKILWANNNLHVLSLIPSFFSLLRLTLIFLFYCFWDGKSSKKERFLS